MVHSAAQFEQHGACHSASFPSALKPRRCRTSRRRKNMVFDVAVPSYSTSQRDDAYAPMADEIVGCLDRHHVLASAFEAAIPVVEPEWNSSTFLSWDASRFEAVRKLQEAPINHGCVDLMRSIDQGGKFVAVKRMPNSWVRNSHEEFKKQYPTSPEEPWSDICMVKYLHARGFNYVCEPLGVFRDATNTYVVNEFANQGDLFNWMDSPVKPGPQRESTMRPIVSEIFTAVCYLHELGIAHRDLSPENVVLTCDFKGAMEVKLIDFGMATRERRCMQSRGKPSFQAPEMFLGPYDAFLADVFQLGVVVFAMAAQDYPWTSTKPGACQLFKYIESYGLRAFISQREVRSDRTKRLNEVFSPEFIDLVESMLSMKPEERLTLGESTWVKERNTSPEPTRRSVWTSAWWSIADTAEELSPCLC